MGKGRLEAFSDGVFAIILTIMVLEIKVPHGADLAAIAPLWPILVSYVLSFVYIGIYWNNHHHMLHASDKIDGKVLWANLHMLFWLSLVPVITGWVGEHHEASLPAAIYGFVLFMSGIAFTVLARTLVACNGYDSKLATAIGPDRKGVLSAVLYLCAIGLAFIHAWLADIVYVIVAAMWFIPDKRIEKHLAAET